MKNRIISKLKLKKKGFSLIELIIVIAIIGILAAISVPKFSSAQDNAKEKADLANAKSIQNAAIMAISSGKIDYDSGIDIKDIKNIESTEEQGTEGEEGAPASENKDVIATIKTYLNSNEIPAVKQNGKQFDLIIDDKGNVSVNITDKTTPSGT